MAYMHVILQLGEGASLKYMVHPLSFLPDKDILHLDVTPSNILVGADVKNYLRAHKVM